MNDDAKEATPACDLESQILSSCVPKNEREWWAHRTILAQRQTLAQQAERIQELEGHLTFLGATERGDGGITLNMKKYHAAHRCEEHGKEPWRGIDADNNCFVCLKQKVGELEAELARRREGEVEP